MCVCLSVLCVLTNFRKTFGKLAWNVVCVRHRGPDRIIREYKTFVSLSVSYWIFSVLSLHLVAQELSSWARNWAGSGYKRSLPFLGNWAIIFLEGLNKTCTFQCNPSVRPSNCETGVPVPTADSQSLGYRISFYHYCVSESVTTHMPARSSNSHFWSQSRKPPHVGVVAIHLLCVSSRVCV